MGGFNLVPLREISEQIGSIITGQDMARNLIYLVGNLWGLRRWFLLPTLFAKQRKSHVFFITVVIAIAVLELLQLMTMRGSFDIDDIILNTVGTCLGFWIMRINQSAALLIQKPKGEH